MRLLLLALIITTPIIADPLLTYTGYAYESDGKSLIYTDHYKELNHQGRHQAKVTYRDPKANIMAQKTIYYNENKASPSFRFENHVTGVIASVNVGKDIQIAYKKSHDSKFEYHTQKLTDNTVIDAGFHYFIRRHWTTLINGDSQEISYLSPSKGRYFTLEIKAIPSITPKTSRFIIQPRSFLARLFVTPIIVTYKSKSKQLLRYQGASNIKLSKVSLTIDMRINHPN
ncbi:MAG: hypothetical protein CL521_03605 [Actinobacteria bacterium]|nr:hypothetical protein [Actinomycetota bacterium]